MIDDFPADATCLQIATEINLPETGFIKCLRGNEFHIRWFKPLVEMALCGHCTLAAGHILYQEGFVAEGPITFQSLSGPLHVYQSEDKITLDFPLQKTGSQLEKTIFQELLSIPVMNAVQAMDDILLEVSAETILHFVPNADIIKTIDCRGLILTAKGDGKPYDVISRFFAPRAGFLEDSVTGSAHCKLADYWQQKLGKTTLHAYQASKRGGELLLKIVGDRLHMSGNAVTMMAGDFSADRAEG